MKGYNRSIETGLAAREIETERAEDKVERQELLADALLHHTIKGRLSDARSLTGQEKKQALERWQDDFERYQVFWAKMLDGAVELIKQNNQIGQREFLSWFDEQAAKAGFCPFIDIGINTHNSQDSKNGEHKPICLFYERLRAADIFKRYKDSNLSVRRFLENTNQGQDGFSALTFGEGKLVGEVTFEQHPLAVIVTCEQESDRRALDGESDKGKNTSRGRYYRSSASFGLASYMFGDGRYALVPVIIQEKDRQFTDHEIRHAINKIVLSDEIDRKKVTKLLGNISWEKDEDEIYGIFHQAVLEFRKIGERGAADEILAYAVQGKSLEWIRNMLISDPYRPAFYDRYEKYRKGWDDWKNLVKDISREFKVDQKKLSRPEYGAPLIDVINNVLGEDYKRIIDIYLNAVFAISRVYGRKTAVSMMSVTPLSKWEKTANHLIYKHDN